MATVQAEIPDEIQDIASALIHSTGLTTADAVRLFMTRIAADGAVPLDLFQPNAETVRAIQDAQVGLVEKTSVDEILQAIDDDRTEKQIRLV